MDAVPRIREPTPPSKKKSSREKKEDDEISIDENCSKCVRNWDMIMTLHDENQELREEVEKMREMMDLMRMEF